MIRQPSSNSALKRKRRRRRRLGRIVFLISIGIVAVFGMVALIAFLLHRPGFPPAEPSSTAQTSSTPATTTTTTTQAPTTTATTAPSKTPEGSGTPVDDTFFQDAAFIGDSRTEGLQLYTGLPGATFYASTGLMVDTFFTKKFVKLDGQKVTIPEAMKKQKFKKVYVMLGVNELGWAYETVFIKKYGDLVDAVKNLQPDATIYIQSILPVTKAKSDQGGFVNNTKIARYNELIEQMCAEKGVKYLHVADSVGLDGGALPAGSASDGIHLNPAYCNKWLEYLRTHTA